MAQEVQTTLDYRAELNEIEGIGYQQRKVSDKMQVRDKWTNSREASASLSASSTTEYKYPTSWTINPTVGGEMYKVDGGDITIPLAGSYLVEFLPRQDFTQTGYFYEVAFFVNGEAKYSITHNLAYHARVSATLNLGRKDKISVGAISMQSSGPYGNIGFRLTKL